MGIRPCNTSIFRAAHDGHSGAVTEPDLVEAARAGDGGAFALLVEPYRRELHAYCRRMLGSAHDAEDAIQEALVRAWRGLPGFEGRSAVRSWLYRIATNICLDLIAKRPKEVLPIDYGRASDPHERPARASVEAARAGRPDDDPGLAIVDATPDARYELRESVELAFIAALQALPARQRAVLILRGALGLTAKEVAEALGTSVPSVNSALQRARRALEERPRERAEQEALGSMRNSSLRARVESYVDAWQRDDVETLVRMLARETV